MYKGHRLVKVEHETDLEPAMRENEGRSIEHLRRVNLDARAHPFNALR